MSEYKFTAEEVRIDSSRYTPNVRLIVEMDTSHAKAAFLTLAGDTRGNELVEWLAELGYEITEIDNSVITSDITDYTMRQGEMGSPDRRA